MPAPRNEKGLTKKQVRYINMAMTFPQLPQAEIARKCDIHPNTVSEWTHDEAFVRELDNALLEQWRDLKRTAQDSMRALVEECNFNACKYVLDSNGYGAPQQIQVSTPDAFTINIIGNTGDSECQQ